MKKITDYNVGFINPPSPFLTDQRVFMSLGILRVATSLKEHTNKVSFIDLSGREDNQYELINNFIEDNSINILCFTATTPQISIVYDLCQYIKSNHNVKIILGGPHITLINSSLENSTDDIKNKSKEHIDRLLKYIDTIVIGDGELSIFNAILSDNQIINSELDDNLFLSNKKYNEIKLDRSFLDIDSYKYEIDGNKSINIISQMGCPFQCEFCSGRKSKSFNRIRFRSTDNIIKEIDFLYKNHNYTGFMFYDDELNLNKHRFKELLEKLIKYQKNNNVKFNFRGFTRSDLLTEKQANLMLEAGFKWLLIGFESGSNKILKNMNKGCTVKQNTECFRIARKSGLKVKALMSIGHPGETMDTINESIKWLKKVKPDETDITIISIYPGSNYFNKSIKISENLLKYENQDGDKLYIRDIDFLKDANFYKSKNDSYISFVHTDNLSENDIIKCRDKIESITQKF